MCAARAYIMHIIGGVLMPDSNNNKGSTVLAVLYRDLCRTTKPAVVNMGGCLTLLQSWAIYRMPFLASMEYLSGYREIIHCPDIPSDDRTACQGRVEWYYGDRVLRQFGCVQYIPDPPCEMARIPQMVMASDLKPSVEYMQ
ncbi:hypothetical protein Gotur_030883 [Gossypium turneri]